MSAEEVVKPSQDTLPAEQAIPASSGAPAAEPAPTGGNNEPKEGSKKGGKLALFLCRRNMKHGFAS